VTRREWSDAHAAKFKRWDLVDAYDRSPRFKGKKVATIRILEIRRSQLTNLSDDSKWGEMELRREGGRWSSVEEFCKLFTIPNPYRVEFEVVSLVKS